MPWSYCNWVQLKTLFCLLTKNSSFWPKLKMFLFQYVQFMFMLPMVLRCLESPMKMNLKITNILSQLIWGSLQRFLVLHGNSVFPALIALALQKSFLRGKASFSEILTRSCKMQMDRSVYFQIFIFISATTINLRKPASCIPLTKKLTSHQVFCFSPAVNPIYCKKKSVPKLMHQLCNKARG